MTQPDRWRTDRRALLHHAAVAGLLAIPSAMLLAACTDGDNGRPMMGASSMPDWMMGEGMMDPAMMTDMSVIMQLLNGHQQIRRQVDDVDGGIRSVTTSSDPHLAQLITDHVAAMKTRIDTNHPIRHGDPLFAEIFKHHNDIHIRIDPADGGVTVTETSTGPQVTLLIRQHARAAVSQFVAQGMPIAGLAASPVSDGSSRRVMRAVWR
jgi:hypothetical protein